jgi:hypothetical protein
VCQFPNCRRLARDSYVLERVVFRDTLQHEHELLECGCYTGILRTAAQHNRANGGVYASVVQSGKVSRGDSVRLG